MEVDAILTTPSALCGCHLAEKLQCHLHLFSVGLGAPTSQMMHPYTDVSTTEGTPVDERVQASWRRASYSLMASMQCIAYGPTVRKFRSEVLHLDPVPTSCDEVQAFLPEHVPHTHVWPQELLATPSDWRSGVDVVEMVHLWFQPPPPDYRAPPLLHQFVQNSATGPSGRLVCADIGMVIRQGPF